MTNRTAGPLHSVDDRRSIDAAALRAGWRVLQRHLRYAAGDPRKLLWIARRALHILRHGEWRGVLQRHRVASDLHGDYAGWMTEAAARAGARMARYREQRPAWRVVPKFSVLMPVYSPSQAMLDEAIESVMAQEYAEWELCIVDDGSPHGTHLEGLSKLVKRDPRVRFAHREVNGGIAAATNDALALAAGDYCVFLDQDDRLAPEALFDFAARAAERPDALLLYADEDRIDNEGSRFRPFFKPAWDPEWLRTTNYVLHPVVVKTALLRDMGGLQPGLDGVQDWDLLLRIAEATPDALVEHVPFVLYHWREHAGSTAAAVYEKRGLVAAQERALRAAIDRRGEQAEVEQSGGVWRIRYRLPDPAPLVSIVIPTRDRMHLLEQCIDGLRGRTHYTPWEAVIIDNGSVEPDTLRFLQDLVKDQRFRVLHDPRPFNYSALCNAGVATARGDVVVLLNNDVVPMSDDWLGEIVAHALRPGIGLVGALLYYPDDTIQHAGVVLGLNGVGDRPYIGYPRGFRGVDGRLSHVHTVTAMITACAAVRRRVYQQVGGMDEQLPVACNDLDLCLKVADLGLRNVLNPYAELYHHESASRGYHYRTANSAQETTDERTFRARWGARLHEDPAYNANLSRTGTAYSLGPANAGTLARAAS